MLKIIGIYTVIGLVVIGLVLYFMWPITHTNTDDFAKTVGVFITLTVAIMTSHIAMLNARLNTRALTEIEGMRERHATELADIQGNITLSINKATEKFKADLTREVDDYREYIRKKSEAYDHVNGVASEYYRTLEKLQNNEWDSAKGDKFYEKMVCCEALVNSLLPDKYQQAWYRLMQDGRNIIAACKEQNSLPPHRIWQRDGEAFRTDYNNLLEEASKRRQA
jgi:hypothetical protein